MTTDLDFAKAADVFMSAVFDRLTELDPDEVDPDLAMGVLSMEFADGTKCIMNRQSAAHQIWLAHGATAWHFERDPNGAWIDTKGRGELLDVLGTVLRERLGHPVDLG
jgi:CyaY protein